MAKEKNLIDIKNLILGIDIGSEFIRGVVTNGEGFVKCYEVISTGIESGVIIDQDCLRKDLIKLFLYITRDFKFFPKSVSVTSGSINIGCVTTMVTHFTKRADSVISVIDIEDIEREAFKKIGSLLGKAILFRKIIKNTVDGREVIGDIMGVYGKRIDSKVFFVYDDVRQVDIIYSVFNSLNIEIDNIVPGMLADAAAVLNKKDRKLGAMSINIGAQTISYIFYENNKPIILGVIKYGGENITSDIALGMRIDIEEAENLKKDLKLRKETGKEKRINEIINIRIAELAKVIDAELSKINRNGLLPGGVVLSGGGSRLYNIEEIIRYEMNISVNNYLKNVEGFNYKKEEDMQDKGGSTTYKNNNFPISDMVFTRSFGATKFIEDFNEIEVYNIVFSMYFNKIKNFILKLLP